MRSQRIGLIAIAEAVFIAGCGKKIEEGASTDPESSDDVSEVSSDEDVKPAAGPEKAMLQYIDHLSDLGKSSARSRTRPVPKRPQSSGKARSRPFRNYRGVLRTIPMMKFPPSA